MKENQACENHKPQITHVAGAKEI